MKKIWIRFCLICFVLLPLMVSCGAKQNTAKQMLPLMGEKETLCFIYRNKTYLRSGVAYIVYVDEQKIGRLAPEHALPVLLETETEKPVLIRLKRDSWVGDFEEELEISLSGKTRYVRFGPDRFFGEFMFREIPSAQAKEEMELLRVYPEKKVVVP